MKRLITLLCLTFLVFFSKQSNAQNFVWAKQIGGLGNQYIHDKLTDQSNHIVYCGISNGVADLDPGSAVFNVHGTQTNVKGFISKMDTAGNIVWIDTFSSTTANGTVWIQSIAVDESDYIYATGSFRGTVDLDPGPGQSLHSTPHYSAIFFLKLDPNGNLEWAKSLDGTALNLNQGYEIIVSKEYGIYVAGTFGNGYIDFDPGPDSTLVSAPVRHIFVAKYDYAGNFIWANSYGGNGPEESCVLDTDEAGNLYLSGQFSLYTDFDPGPGVYMPYPLYQEKLYVLKWDKDGIFKWVRCFVGTGGSSYSNDIKYDGAGSLYVCGGYSGTMDFGPGADGGIMTSSSYLSSFVVKMDTSGLYTWSFSIDYSSAEAGHLDVNNDYYVSGHFHNPGSDFDPGTGTHMLYPTNFAETYVAKYTSNMDFVWAKAFQSAGLSRSYSLTLDSVGNIYTGGYFSGTTDFDPSAASFTYTSSGDDDIYIQKMRQCYINRGITQNGSTLFATATNVTYKWLNCTTGQLISGAQSSSYTPTQTGSYAVIVRKDNNCFDTSDCINFVDTSTNIRTPHLEDLISIYPNPNSGKFTIDIPDQLKVQRIWISDALGRNLLSLNNPNNLQTIDVNYASGLYFINIQMQDGVMLRKKIILRE